MTKQYIDLCQKILDEGVYIENERTGKKCLTIINADLEYNVGAGEFPLVTTRKSFWKPALGELIGYLRGDDDADSFAKLLAKTWLKDAANLNWIKNPMRRIAWASKFSPGRSPEEIPDTYMGRQYGIQGRSWLIPDSLLPVWHKHRTVDQFRKIIDNLSEGIDDRGEIMLFWNPAELDYGCLRPCLYSYHFSILDGTLYLHATQRSCDVPLGLNFNMVQVYAMLAIVAQITGLKPGIAYHKIVNAHMYEDQVDLMRDIQVKRTPGPQPRLYLPEELETLEDLETWVTPDDFTVENYEPQGPVKYPFTTGKERTE